MIILLSPSKTIHFKQYDITPTTPEFLEQSQQLVTAVNKLGPKLASVFGVSNAIASENEKQFKAWSASPKPSESCPAAWAYRGETFAGLSIEKLDKTSLAFAQKKLFIISGLYGLLRPTDVIMPYRLEMSTKLKGPWGETLYEFWGDMLAKEIEKQKPEFILNCASDEYFSAVKKYLPKNLPVVTPTFLHNGMKKMAFSKYSRGLMARWAIEEKITKPEDVQKFHEEGYVFDAKNSQQNEPIFIAPKDFSLAGRWKKT
jgi:cytoplasmic iron level regulating protein YaaA (DUF328/UPF0246 family)